MRNDQQTWDDMQQIQQMLDNVNYVDRSFTGNFMTGLKQGGMGMVGSIGGLARMAGATGLGDYLTGLDDQYQASVPQTGYNPADAQQVLMDAVNPSSQLWSSGEGGRLLGQGIASVISFAIPQALGARAAIAGANALGKIGQVKKFTDFVAGSKVAQNVLGSTFPAVNESLTEGGTEYNDVYRKTGDDNQASIAAAQTIGDNMGLLLGTDGAEMALAFATPGGKVFQAATKGLTGKIATAGAKVAGVGAMEGYQEIMQQRIQDAASDGTGGIFSGDVSWTPAPQTIDEAMSGVAGAITGGAIGGAGHLLSGNRNPAPAITDQEQQDAGATVPGTVDPNAPTNATGVGVTPTVIDNAATRTPVSDAHVAAMQNIIQNYNDPNVDTSAISSDDARLIDEFPNMSHETQAAAIPGLVERNQQFALYNPAPAPTITTPQVDPALQSAFDDTVNRLSDPNSNIQLTSSEQNVLNRLPSMPYEQKVNAMNAMVRKYATPVTETQAVPQEQQQPQQETQKAFTRPELKTAHDNLVANINDPAVDTSMVNQHDLNSLKNMGRMPQQTRAKEMARIAAAYPVLTQRNVAQTAETQQTAPVQTDPMVQQAQNATKQPQSPVATTSNNTGTNTSAAPNSSVTGQINKQASQQAPKKQRRSLEDIVNSRPEAAPQESPVNNVKSQRLEQRLAGKVSPTKADTTIAEVVSEAAGVNSLASEIAASDKITKIENENAKGHSDKAAFSQRFKNMKKGNKKDNTLKAYVPLSAQGKEVRIQEIQEEIRRRRNKWRLNDTGEVEYEAPVSELRNIRSDPHLTLGDKLAKEELRETFDPDTGVVKTKNPELYNPLAAEEDFNRRNKTYSSKEEANEEREMYKEAVRRVNEEENHQTFEKNKAVETEPTTLEGFKGKLSMVTYKRADGKEYYRLFQKSNDGKEYAFTPESSGTKEEQMNLGKHMMNKIYSGAAPKFGKMNEKNKAATMKTVKRIGSLSATKSGIYVAEWVNWYDNYFNKEKSSFIAQIKKIFGDTNTATRIEKSLDGEQGEQKEVTEKDINKELAGKLFMFYASNPFAKKASNHVGGLVEATIKNVIESTKAQFSESPDSMFAPAYDGFIKGLIAYKNKDYKGSPTTYIFNGVRSEVNKVMQEEDGYHGSDMKNIKAYKTAFAKILEKTGESPTPEQTWEYIVNENKKEYDNKAGTFAQEPTLRDVVNAVAQDRGTKQNTKGLLNYIEKFRKNNNGREPMYEEGKDFIKPNLTEKSYLDSVDKYLNPLSSFEESYMGESHIDEATGEEVAQGNDITAERSKRKLTLDEIIHDTVEDPSFKAWYENEGLTDEDIREVLKDYTNYDKIKEQDQNTVKATIPTTEQMAEQYFGDTEADSIAAAQMLKEQINKTIAKVYNKANPYFQFGEGVLDNAERRDGRGVQGKGESIGRTNERTQQGVREDNWQETIGRSFGVQDPNIFVRSVDSYFRGPLESVKEGTDEARACSRTREALTRCASSRKEFGDFVKYTSEASFRIAPEDLRQQGVPYFYNPDKKIIYMNPDVINKFTDDKLVETLVLHEFIHDATNIGLSRHAINVVMEDSRGLGQELNDHIQENGTEEQKAALELLQNFVNQFSSMGLINKLTGVAAKLVEMGDSDPVLAKIARAIEAAATDAGYEYQSPQYPAMALFHSLVHKALNGQQYNEFIKGAGPELLAYHGSQDYIGVIFSETNKNNKQYFELSTGAVTVFAPFRNAAEKLIKSLNIKNPIVHSPKEGVKIEEKRQSAGMSFEEYFFSSMHEIVKNHPELKPFFDMAVRAYRMITAFRERWTKNAQGIWESVSHTIADRNAFIELRKYLDEVHREPISGIRDQHGNIHLVRMDDTTIYTKNFKTANRMRNQLNERFGITKVIALGDGAFQVFATNHPTAEVFRDETEFRNVQKNQTRREIVRLGYSPVVADAYMKMRLLYNQMHKRAETVNKLTGRNTFGYLEGYLPHYFENWILYIRDKDGNLVDTQSYATRNEAIMIANDQAEQGNKVYIKPKANIMSENTHGEFMAQLAESEATAQEIAALEREGTLTHEDVKILFKDMFDPESEILKAARSYGETTIEKDDLMKILTRNDNVTEDDVRKSGVLRQFANAKGPIAMNAVIAYLRSKNAGMRSNGFLKKRKGAEGWSTEMKHIDFRYINVMSRYCGMQPFKHNAWNEYAKLATEHNNGRETTIDMEPPDELCRYLRTWLFDVNGNITGTEELLNRMIGHIPFLGNFLGKVYGDRPALHLANMTTQAMTVLKLGLFAPSSALLQFTGLLNSTAILSPKWIQKGIAAMRSNDGRHKAIYKKAGLAEALGLMDVSGYGHNMYDKPTMAKFKYAMKNGTISEKVKMISDLSLTPFVYTDRWVKKATILGAYYKAMAGEAEGVEGNNHKEAIEYAKKILRNTQYDNAVYDKPGILRYWGPLGQVLLQFKNYQIKTMEFVRHELKGSQKIAWWASFMLMAGVAGFPGADLLMQLFKVITGYDAETRLKKKMFEMAGDNTLFRAAATHFWYGAGAFLPGGMAVDVSRRVGLQDIVPTDLKSAFGPAVGTVLGAAQVLRDNPMNTDTGILLAKSVAPSLGNVMQAIAGESRSSVDRERLNVVYTPQERLVRALGFSPLREAQEQDVTHVIKSEENRIKEQNKSLIDKYLSGGATRSELDKAGITSEQIKNEIQRKRTTRIERVDDNIPKARKNEYNNFSKAVLG